MSQNPGGRRPRTRAGNSLVELTLSAALVALLLVAAMSATAQSLLAQRQSANRATGRFLARALLAEILQAEYQEPGSANSPLGLDEGETIGARGTFDDVDDYHGYGDSPPKTRLGVSLTNYTGWARAVAVTWVDPATLTTTNSADTGVKHVSVSALHQGVVVYVAEGYRTNTP